MLKFTNLGINYVTTLNYVYPLTKEFKEIISQFAKNKSNEKLSYKEITMYLEGLTLMKGEEYVKKKYMNSHE